MTTQQQRPQPTAPRPVRALLVRRFRLAIIDDTNRPVIGICEVPADLVERTAEFLRGLVPTIQALGNIRGQVSALFASIEATFGSSPAPRRRRKGGR